MPAGTLGGGAGDEDGDALRAGDRGSGGGDPRVAGGDVRVGDVAPMTCPGGYASIAFSQSELDTDNDGSHSWWHDVRGSHRLLLVGVVRRGTAVSVDTVTFDRIALEPVGATGPEPTLELFVMVAPPTGSHRVEVELTGPTDAVAGSVSLVGVEATSWVDGVATIAHGQGNTASITATTYTPGAWVLDFLATHRADATPSRFHDEILSGFQNTWRVFSSISGPHGTPGAVTLEWSLNMSEKWRVMALPIRPACLP